MARLHDDEVPITTDLARHLIDSQFPSWRALPIESIGTPGTVNVVYRLGDSLAIRMPRTGADARGLRDELKWLPRLAPLLPLRIPSPVATGHPDDRYPLPWAVYDWIPGRTWSLEHPPDEYEAASRLAAFVQAMRGIATAGAPRSTRDTPLPRRDAHARRAIAAIDEFDQMALHQAWERCLAAPAWEGPGVWTHADLLPPNLLVCDGALTAVLDFGHPGVGDPALDLAPAWTVFGASGRARFQAVLGGEDGLWARAAGYALFQALLIIPYYRESHPAFTATAVRTVHEILEYT